MIAIFVTTIFLIFLCSFARRNTILNNKFTVNSTLFFLIIIIGISIYFTNTYAIPDLVTYSNWFFSYIDAPIEHSGIFSHKDPLFFLLQWFIAQLTGSINVFLVVIWIIFSVIFIKSLKNMFHPSKISFVFLSYTSFFLFFNFVLNTMRQGIAISLLMLAISILVFKKHKTKTFIFIVILSPLFHITALPLSLALLLLRFFNFKLRTIFLFWSASVILFVTNVNGKLLGGVQNTMFSAYSSDNFILRYGSVNRLDFLLFSSFWVISGLIIWKYVLNKDENYGHLLKIYLIFNSYFLLLGFIAYSDRLAAYSWFIIPILIWKSVLPMRNPRLKSILILATFLVLGITTGSYDYVFQRP